MDFPININNIKSEIENKIRVSPNSNKKLRALVYKQQQKILHNNIFSLKVISLSQQYSNSNLTTNYSSFDFKSYL